MQKNIAYYIEEQLKTKERQEVLDAKQKIKMSFLGLKFIEKTHQYFSYHNGKQIEYTCVSDICHRFKSPSDWDSIAFNYAAKHKKTKKEIQELWDYNKLKGTNSGTKSHNFAESYFYYVKGKEEGIRTCCKHQYEGGYLFAHSPKEEAIIKFFEYVESNPDLIFVLCETRVFSREYNYSGTFDLLLYSISQKGFIIGDYKTNKELTKEFKKPLLAPFQSYNDESLSDYTIQLSLYQIPLEDIGLPIIGRVIIYLKDTGEYEAIPLEDESVALREVLNPKATLPIKTNFNVFPGFS